MLVENGNDIFDNDGDFILGMKPDMVIDGTDYYIHCIFSRKPGDEVLYYLKILVD